LEATFFSEEKCRYTNGKISTNFWMLLHKNSYQNPGITARFIVTTNFHSFPPIFKCRGILSLPSSFSSASFNRPPFYLISFELYKYKYVLPPFFPRGNCFTVAFFHDGDDDEVLFVCLIFPSFVVAAPERISRGKYSPTFLWQLFRLAGWNGSGNAAPANPHLSKALHRAATLPRRGNVTTRRVSKMKIIINRNKLQINIKARSHQSNDFQKKMMN